MPNWCNNSVTFTHANTDMIKRVSDAFAAERLMSEFHPCPASLNITDGWFGAGTAEQIKLEAKEAKNRKEHGYKNWYDWNIANWGTKWDVGSKDDTGGYELGDTVITVSFDSAWSPPVKFYEKMEELGFEVEAYYYEPGMAFCGCYTKGVDDSYEIVGDSVWVEDNIPAEINEAFAISETMLTWESGEV